MNADMIQALVANAVSTALADQEKRLRSRFASELEAVRTQVSALIVEVNKRAVPNPKKKCDVKLDIVKSLPTFNGSHDEYVSWRQAALDAYEVFKKYDGSEAHYEALVIIKKKICGPARSLLTSHNTVLNFDAILARLDCLYADKTSLRVLWQNLEMVRQGDADLMAYYDEVERKLTLVTNKIVMSHNSETATILNKEVRPSRSPYYNPTWVVDKKGTDDNGIKKKRLVIDFRKLNEGTIADPYPMPSIPMILANLGKAKFFTTLGLRSGYHQIYPAEKDREKTTFSVNDHQPLTYALSDKNTNAKIKRWKAFIDENNGKVLYTPRKQNLVADALSRQPLNNLEAEAQSDAATVHIQYPRVKLICKKVLLIPAAHYHSMLQTEDNIVAECYDGILAVVDCASTNLPTFCKKASHDTCARQLHAGGVATSRTRPSNLEPLTIVDDGVIIVNEKLTRITIDDGPTTSIVGTHLIAFERKAVSNDSVYLNLNYAVNRSPGIAASPLIIIMGHDHNLRLMQELRDDESAGGSPKIWFAAGVAVSLTLCA
ncbi:hypothetical protein KR067_012428 [Drosophila pandora]|nr:hypothetical protein KR067_012428 [Drosophila pandora]